jgi:hypothetical protein
MKAHSPIGSKRPRKKARPPQAISEKLWETIKLACVGGMGFSEAARHFGVSPHAVIMRSRREFWPISSRIEERARLLQASLQRQSEAAQERRNGNDQAVEAAAQSWAEKGEMHRLLAFQLANGALAAAAKTGGLPISDWRDADLCDKVARRNAGLDHDHHELNVNMALVNARLETISLSLPKDAPQSPVGS